MWASWRPDAKAVLRDKKARTSLARYFDVMEDDKPAKFLIAKKLPADGAGNAERELGPVLGSCKLNLKGIGAVAVDDPTQTIK